MKKNISGFETSTQEEYTALSKTKGVKAWCIKRIIFITNPAAIMIIFSLLLASQRDRGGVSKSPALASNPQSTAVKHVCQKQSFILTL